MGAAFISFLPCWRFLPVQNNSIGLMAYVFAGVTATEFLVVLLPITGVRCGAACAARTTSGA
jgi:hypothetical protein